MTTARVPAPPAGRDSKPIAGTDSPARDDEQTLEPSRSDDRVAGEGRVADEGHERVLLIALFALVALVAMWSVAPWPVGVFGDDGIYTVLARSLAEGNGFRLTNLPGQPHNTHYPPGYPLVLALLWRLWPVFPDNVVLFKFANAALLGVVALGSYAFARRHFSFGVVAALGVAVIGTVSVPVLYVAGLVMSEPLFMALLLPVLMLAERVSKSARVGDAFVLGLLLGALTLVRTMGALAIPALLLVCCVRRQWRTAAVAALGAALLIVPWQLWVAAWKHEVPQVLTGKYGSYSAWLVDGYSAGGWPFARDVVLENVSTISMYLGGMVMPLEAAWLRVAAFAVVCVPLGAGAVSMTRRTPVTALFLAAYMGVVCLWPFSAWRFLVAVWPLLVLVMAVGVQALWRFRPELAPARVGRGVLLATIAVLAVAYAAYNANGYRDRSWESFQREEGERGKAMAEWVARNTAPDDLISTNLDLIVYLYTGRQAVPSSSLVPEEFVRELAPEQHLEALRRILAAYDPDFVLAGSLPVLRAARALESESPPSLRYHGASSKALIFESSR